MYALASTINMLFRIYSFIIIARVIVSWVRVSPYHPTWGPVVRFIYQATEPLMEPVRRFLPAMGGLDFSPIIVLLGLDLIRTLVVGMLLG
ncbi:MAG: YggT family protein [Candidatus Promineifilaceae bacterium]